MARPRPHLLPSRPLIYTGADQLVSSASNFLAGVLVGRLAGPSEFGHYMIAFTVWLVVLGLNRALLVEPMIIKGHNGMDDAEWLRRGIRSQLQMAVVFGAAIAGLATVFALVGAGSTATPLYVLAVLIGPLLLQDLWRGMAFHYVMPDRALVNDLVFTVVEVIAFTVMVVTDLRSAGWLLLAWGSGAVAGALVGFWQFSVRPRLSSPSLIGGFWPMSRWLAADFSTTFSADQMYLLVVAWVLGTSDFGGLKAALSLMGPAIVILVTGGNVGLPAMARSFRDGGVPGMVHQVRRLTVVVWGALTLYGLVVVALGRFAIEFLYGEEFARFGSLASIAALQYIVGTASFGITMALKVAGKTRLLIVPRLALTVLSIVLVLGLSHWFGLAGAAWAGVVGMAVSVAVQFAVYNHAIHSPQRVARIPARTRPSGVAS